jgi:hypothetical protein
MLTALRLQLHLLLLQTCRLQLLHLRPMVVVVLVVLVVRSQERVFTTVAAACSR